MTSDIQKNQGSPAKPGVESHDPQNRDPNGIMEHVKVSNEQMFSPFVSIRLCDKVSS